MRSLTRQGTYGFSLDFLLPPWLLGSLTNTCPSCLVIPTDPVLLLAPLFMLSVLLRKGRGYGMLCFATSLVTSHGILWGILTLFCFQMRRRAVSHFRHLKAWSFPNLWERLVCLMQGSLEPVSLGVIIDIDE